MGGFFILVEHTGFEPVTSTLPVLRAPNCANAPKKKSTKPSMWDCACNGGSYRARTCDPLLVGQMLSQLS